jgi:hypothetical protein
MLPFCMFVQHFLQLIVNPLMHGKNATRKVQSFEEISLKISEQMDINQLDMFQDTFSGRWPLLNLFDNRLAGMWPLTTQVCRGGNSYQCDFLYFLSAQSWLRTRSCSPGWPANTSMWASPRCTNLVRLPFSTASASQ